jgi:hypothetical protein
MIIKNGFVKAEDGAWIQLSRVIYAGVCQVKPIGGPDYYIIGFRVDGNEEEFINASMSPYNTKDEAYAALDAFIMS